MFALNWFYHFSAALVYVNSCINPFIYAAKYAEFQNGVRRMIARLTGNAQGVQPRQNIVDVQVVSNPIQQESPGTGVT